jgi:hypothetical protein
MIESSRWEPKMGITDKFSQFAGQVQDGVKNTSTSVFLIMLKLLTALGVGLTISLIGQEMMNYGNFAFVFLMVVVVGGLLKLMSSWRLGAVLLFDLFCILVALLLRLYIQIAP